jgi:hypothetical protein
MKLIYQNLLHKVDNRYMAGFFFKFCYFIYFTFQISALEDALETITKEIEKLEEKLEEELQVLELLKHTHSFAVQATINAQIMIEGLISLAKSVENNLQKMRKIRNSKVGK